MSASSDASRIARGGQPVPWTETFKHPVHGDLTFTAAMPTALAMAQHSIEMDNLLAELEGEARGATLVLVAAIAGLKESPRTPGRSLIVKLPVIDERQVEEEENGHVRIERTYYDAQAELDTGFLVTVWTRFSMWRAELLEEVDAVKGPSGATGGSASSTPSDAPTSSPSTIPA